MSHPGRKGRVCDGSTPRASSVTAGFDTHQLFRPDLTPGPHGGRELTRSGDVLKRVGLSAGGARSDRADGAPRLDTAPLGASSFGASNMRCSHDLSGWSIPSGSLRCFEKHARGWGPYIWMPKVRLFRFSIRKQRLQQLRTALPVINHSHRLAHLPARPA